MISAGIAWDKTRFQAKIIEFRNNIDKSIEKAISEGKYGCEVMFDCALPDSVRKEISMELRENGYDFIMPPYEKQPSDIPCDQAKYYDYLTINWGRANE